MTEVDGAFPRARAVAKTHLFLGFGAELLIDELGQVLHVPPAAVLFRGVVAAVLE